MRTALLVYAAAGLLAAGNAVADETDNRATDGRYEVDGVWYGVYKNYVNPFSDGSSKSTCGSARSGGGPGCIRNPFETASRMEPVFYVLTLEVRGDEVTGTMTEGPGLKYEDPQAAMKKVLGLSLEGAPSAPARRQIEGHFEDERMTLTVLPAANREEAETAVVAEVDADRMRATIEVPNGDERIVRLDRCKLDTATAGSATGTDAATDEPAYCAVDAIWRRLSQEHGVIIDPNPAAPFGRR